MILLYFHAGCLAFAENEVQSPLSIQSYAPLSRPVTRKLFQSIAGRKPQIIHAFGTIKHLQFPLRLGLERMELRRTLPTEQGFRAFAGKVLDHIVLV